MNRRGTKNGVWTPGMRFFTRELFVRINSADQQIADEAEADWERAIVAYRTHIDDLRPRLSASAARLSTLTLHDWDVVDTLLTVSLRPGSLEPSRHESFRLYLRRDGEDASLTYTLWTDLHTSSPPIDWPFSKEKRHWLYDEVDLAESAGGTRFVHRILFSDGSVNVVPFTRCILTGQLLVGRGKGAAISS